MPTSVSRPLVKETRENRGKRAGESLDSQGRAELGYEEMINFSWLFIKNLFNSCLILLLSYKWSL